MSHPHQQSNHHSGLAMGHLPTPCIGMIAAPSAAGPVLAGIGVPIMTATTRALVAPPPQIPTSLHSQQFHSAHKTMVMSMSPDSSGDKGNCGGHSFRPAHTSQSVGAGCAASADPQLSWPAAAPLVPAALTYSVMGIPPGSLAESTGMIYGVAVSTGSALSDHQVATGITAMPSMVALPATGVAPCSSGRVATSAPTSLSTPSVIPLPMSCSIGDSSGSSQQHSTKEIIHCKSCTLFPPNVSAPSPTTRERPPGCRTVFVGGLPENVSEDIVREIFERCGDITTIRMSKKNFCHIRFELEELVEVALYLSGYRIRIGSNSDSANIGRLHVDYAQARDDLYEWECRQRQLQREQRHRERVEQERLQPASPPPTVYYSDHEAANVAERIRGDDTFMKAIQTVLTWLEKGECVKRNSNTFYSMIQSTNSQIRRLLNEKSQFEDDFQRAKDLMMQRLTGLLMQFTQIEKVFSAACQRKVWDHFTRAQRKNIEVWLKQATEIKTVLLEEALLERADEEMELSDIEIETEAQDQLECGEPRAKKMRKRNDSKTVHQLQEENDALRCQLEASKNEVDLLKADLRSELETKDQQLKSLQQQVMMSQGRFTSGDRVAVSDMAALHALSAAKHNLHSPVSVSSSSPAFGLSPAETLNNCGGGESRDTPRDVMTSTSTRHYKDATEGNCDSSSGGASVTRSQVHHQPQQSAVNNLRSFNHTEQANVPNLVNITYGSGAAEDACIRHREHSIGPAASFGNNNDAMCSAGAAVGMSEMEARLLAIISTFLHVHPFGASLDYMWSYAQKVLPQVRPSEIEGLMGRFPSLFRQQVSGAQELAAVEALTS